MINGLRNIKAISRVLLGRLELYSKLLAVEAKIETTLVVRRLVWAGVGIVFGFFAIAMIHTAILGHFWGTEYRLAALIAVLLTDGLIAGVSLYIASKPAKQEAFSVTKHQLAEDIKFVKESI
jgi:uncharacterized membrane protein YqjE